MPYTTRPSRVKRLLREGKVALGTYAHMADPAQVEIAGLSGFDAVSLHWEYTSMDFRLIEEMIRAADATEIDCIVRVPENDPQLIKRLLDIGAHGIWLTRDGTGFEGAKRALAAMRYPPNGHRGASLRTRADGYGAVRWEDHLRRSEEEIVLVASIEDRAAFEDLERLAGLDGVDLLFIAVFDVARELGVSWDDPRVMEKWEEIAERVSKVGKAKLMLPYDHTHLKLTPQDLKRLGCGYAHVVPPATTILVRHFQAKSFEIRSGLGELPG